MSEEKVLTIVEEHLLTLNPVKRREFEEKLKRVIKHLADIPF